MLSKEKAYSIIDFVLAEAKGHETRVIVQGETEALSRIANSEIHQNVQATGLSTTIIVTRGKRRSEISTELHTEAGLRQAVRQAIANLEFLPEGEEQPPLVEAPEEIVAMELDTQLEQQYSVENRAKLIGSALATLDEGYKAYGSLAYKVNMIAVGNSRGIKRLALVNSVDFTALAARESGGSGYARATSTRADQLDIPATFSRAYEKARLNCNPEQLEPGSYTVILEPLAVGDILTYLSYLGFSGKSVQNKTSFLSGKLNKRVFGDNITITDDHKDPNTVSLPFDFEGSPRQQVAIIQSGVAKGLTYDLASAREDGVKSTGHSVNMPQAGGLPLHLVMAGGEKSLQEIIADTEDGLLVTRFHYMNPVNPRTALLTALTRDGLFRIKGGKLTGAVQNLRFTESMLHALNNVEAISAERERTSFFFGNYYVPALKIRDFHFTGKTS